MSYAYICRNNHTSQDDTTDEPDIICPECGEIAYWQAVDSTIFPYRLPEIKTPADDDTDIAVDVTHFSGNYAIRECVVCGEEFKPKIKKQVTCGKASCRARNQIQIYDKNNKKAREKK